MTNGNLKKNAAEEIWLLYFNQKLFEREIISEKERNRMISLIHARCGSASHHNKAV